MIDLPFDNCFVLNECVIRIRLRESIHSLHLWLLHMIGVYPGVFLQTCATEFQTSATEFQTSAEEFRFSFRSLNQEGLGSNRIG